MAFREGASGADCGCCMPRRGFLAALAGGAALAAGAGSTLAAPAVKRDIVDVHAHFPPPPAAGAAPVRGPMGDWSVEKYIADMDAAGVAKSILSVTAPGITVIGAERWPLIRRTNEAGAKIVSDHPSRFGLFLYVDPTDVDAGLREIAYGFDTLKAHGVGLFTNYEGKLLGDPVFDPIWAELNRRKAVVYVHPTGNVCCGRTGPMTPGLGDNMIEYPTDTSRAIVRYVYGGAARKFPDVRMIWSHSGGTLPFVIERFDQADRNPALKENMPNGFRAEIGKFFYDVAQTATPVATQALRSVVPTQQIVFGSDYPFRTLQDHVQALETGKVFNAAELRGIYRGNVARALPSLLV